MDTRLKDGINWVGAIDWNIRDFHSYQTDRGATYNSYLVRDEKVAVIDGVKWMFADDQAREIERFLPLTKIDYVVCLHAEPDHASGLPSLMARAPQATLVCSQRCHDTIKREFGLDAVAKWQIIKTGDTLPLGKRSLQFIEAPMVHWPDSTFAYMPEEKILFSNDAFGQHYATRNRFADEVDRAIVMEEARTYYANIVQPYASPVQKTLAVAGKLDIGMIATAHGLSWRRPEDIAAILGHYQDWSAGKNKKKVFVLYETMWEATAKMALAVAEGADLPGVDVRVQFMRRTNLTKVATEALDAACFAFGSSTINNAMMPVMAGAMSYLQGLRPQNKAGFAFGSYGWAAQGGTLEVEERMKAMKVDIVCDAIRSQNQPTDEVLQQCRAAGRKLGERALQA